MDDHDNILSQKLTELRKEKNTTQEDFADFLGVSNKTVSKWENGASSPDINLIPKIAVYFDIAIDELFGVSKQKTINNAIKSEYENLSRSEAVNKSFELGMNVICGCIGSFFDDREEGVYQVPKHIVSNNKNMYRSVVSNDIAYEIVINSSNVNMQVILLGNDNNFNWIENNLKDYIPVFSFLSDSNSLKITKLIHQKGFPLKFTADYIAQKADIDLASAITVLEKAIEIKLCKKSIANLKDGKVDIYEAGGDGKILSIITLAYEHICGISNNQMASHGSVKLIRGENI